MLKVADQGTIRFSIGVLLIVFSLYNLFRPAIKPVQGGVPRELGVGVVNGLIGGLTGLGGIAVTLWCQLQGWPQGRAARDLSAGDVRDLRDDRRVARLRRCVSPSKR